MVVVRPSTASSSLLAQSAHGQAGHTCTAACAVGADLGTALDAAQSAVPPGPATPAALQLALRQAGLRSTPARVAVLQALLHASAPLSHAEVGELLESSLWDRATLYRNLTDLAKAGLARRVDLGDHIWRFEATKPGHTATAHPHFVCTSCGSVACVAGVELVLAPEAATSPMLAQQLEVQLKGLCDSCR